MHPTRFVLWIIGVALVVGGVALLLIESGLGKFIPAGVAVAGLLLIVGLVVMSLSEEAPEPTHGHDTHTTHGTHREPMVREDRHETVVREEHHH